jgi:Fe-Mn family superoxide dismutase
MYDREKLKPGYKGEFVIHHHYAHAEHFDLRLEFPVINLSESLKTYNKKRDFKKTPEPGPRYTDKSVLRSWAIPKHKIPSENQPPILATETEDHEFSYRKFKGIIPEGEYGAGKVEIFDHGTFEIVDMVYDKKYIIDFKGKKLKGLYSLVKMSGKNFLWGKVKNKEKYLKMAIKVASRYAKDSDDLEKFIPGKHEIKPLPFDPKKLKGISEKMIKSHWENNYGAAIKGLNGVEKQLSEIKKDTPSFIVYGLKDRELNFSNSIILHEHYFGNLGGDGKPLNPVIDAINKTYGSYNQWEKIFKSAAMSLAGGSGWCILDFNLYSGDLRIYCSQNHTQAIAFGEPLLVLDLFEHAYQMDFGADTEKYIDIFMKNISWNEVNHRYDQAIQVLKALASRPL